MDGRGLLSFSAQTLQLWFWEAARPLPCSSCNQLPSPSFSFCWLLPWSLFDPTLGLHQCSDSCIGLEYGKSAAKHTVTPSLFLSGDESPKRVFFWSCPGCLALTYLSGPIVQGVSPYLYGGLQPAPLQYGVQWICLQYGVQHWVQWRLQHWLGLGCERILFTSLYHWF